jgi:hypothetical protein
MAGETEERKEEVQAPPTLSRMKRLTIIAILLLSPALPAKEGFSVTLGVGGGIWNLDRGSLRSSLSGSSKYVPGDEERLLETISNGLALRFSMAYNILGYASIEAGLTAHGWNLGDSGSIGGSGHIGGVAHIHPFQFFMPERDFDATFFLGGSYSIIGGGHADENEDRGLDGGALELGFTGRYFPVSWVSFGAEIRFHFPFYDHWHTDWDDNEHYSIDPSPDAMFLSLLFLTSFHFQAG